MNISKCISLAPSEILRKIFTEYSLDINDLVIIRKVCKRFKEIADSPQVFSLLTESLQIHTFALIKKLPMTALPEMKILAILVNLKANFILRPRAELREIPFNKFLKTIRDLYFLISNSEFDKKHAAKFQILEHYLICLIAEGKIPLLIKNQASLTRVENKFATFIQDHMSSPFKNIVLAFLKRPDFKEYFHILLSSAAADSKNEFVSTLLSLGINPNYFRNYENYTKGYHPAPIHTATQSENSSLITILYEFKADLNLHNHSGRTPLHLCFSDNKFNRNIAELLIRYKADPSIRNFLSEIPYFIALENKERDIEFLRPISEHIDIQPNEMKCSWDLWKWVPFFKNLKSFKAHKGIWGRGWGSNEKEGFIFFQRPKIDHANGSSWAPTEMSWSQPNVDHVDLSKGKFLNQISLNHVFTAFPNARIYNFSECVFDFDDCTIATFKSLKNRTKKGKIILDGVVVNGIPIDLFLRNDFNASYNREEAEKFLKENSNSLIIRKSSLAKKEFFSFFALSINSIGISHHLFAYDFSTKKYYAAKSRGNQIEILPESFTNFEEYYKKIHTKTNP